MFLLFLLLLLYKKSNWNCQNKRKDNIKNTLTVQNTEKGLLPNVVTRILVQWQSQLEEKTPTLFEKEWKGMHAKCCENGNAKQTKTELKFLRTTIYPFVRGKRISAISKFTQPSRLIKTARFTWAFPSGAKIPHAHRTPKA